MGAITKTGKSRQIKSDTHQTACGVQTEDIPPYGVEIEDGVIQKALDVLALRIKKPESFLNKPEDVRDFLRIKLAGLEHEIFSIVFLNSQRGVITVEELFRGTLSQTTVYPREILKRVMHHNAAAVILAHNHPSGIAEPSHADKYLTETLRKTFSLIDVAVLDHFIVAGTEYVSFAERGLI
ncbi:DNA repair protein RadC [Ferrovum sp.]|uniref:JAB domain-containing protein n=1 Tax=Ferrovum sp. TaxID=2609467 RepID=UPI0026307596|nr:DNA repair protein RadC [Ferrovum sp.]